MRIRWSHLLVPIAGGGLAAALAPVELWDTLRMPLMTALSVIAAAVLVRLARGLPFSSVDQLALDEARRFAKVTKQIARSLKALLIIAFIAMGLLVFAKTLSVPLQGYLEAHSPVLAEQVDAAASALIGFFLTYVFVRVLAVIAGDVSLTEIQSDALVHAVERKQAAEFEKVIRKSEVPPFKSTPGYGKIIQ